ncbi:uncharacterized protein LOC134223657 [Armigeres subalbatus]|uniref:uncharacterized protein LOC134223657 n=1 Tax=Armigeres subalbatus TaxID=124917 RepID=UPI002ED17CC7
MSANACDTKRVFVKRCKVVNCKSSSVSNPGMCFLNVPKNSYRRRAWMTLMNPDSRSKKISSFPRKMYCCERHFDLEEDLVDYEDYQRSGIVCKRYLKLKKGVRPHKDLPYRSDRDSDSDDSVESLNTAKRPKRLKSGQARGRPPGNTASSNDDLTLLFECAPLSPEIKSETSLDGITRPDTPEDMNYEIELVSDTQDSMNSSSNSVESTHPACTVPSCGNPFPLWTAQFPRDPSLRQRWLEAIYAGTGQILPLEPAPVVCNLHFSDKTISVENYREPTIYQHDDSLTFVSCCRLCSSFEDSSKMFHSSQCLLPGQTIKTIADKYFKAFEASIECAEDGFLCEGCTVRLDMIHSIWLEVNQEMERNKHLLVKMSKETILPVCKTSQSQQEDIVKEEILLETSGPSSMDQDSTEPHSTHPPIVSLRLKGVTDDVMQNAINRVLQGGVLRQVATEYGLSHQTLYRYVRKRKSTQEKSSLLRPEHENFNQVFTKEQEANLAEYVIRVINLLYGISYRNLRKIAFQYAKTNKITYPHKWNCEQMTGMGWVVGFLKRNPQIAEQTPKGCDISKNATFDLSHIEVSYSALEKAFKIHSTFADGTRLFLLGEANTFKRYLPTYFNIIPIKMFVIANPLGKRIPPIIVFPTTHIPKSKKASSGVLCLTSSSGTITQELFPEVVQHLCNHINASPTSPALLVCDNYEDWLSSSTTLDLCGSSGLSVVTLPRQYTKSVQAQRGNVFSELHNAYKNISEQWLRQHGRPGVGPTTDLVVRWTDEVYAKNYCKQRAAECFRKFGVFPLNRRAKEGISFVTK